MKYQKKPVIIEAEQFKGDPKQKGVCTCGVLMEGIIGGCQPHLHTIHQGQRVDLEIGDWIIPEPDGIHYYPCKNGVFERTYEPLVN